MKHRLILGGMAALFLAPSALAQIAGPVVTVGDQEFASWEEYVRSNAFQAYGLRCGTPDQDPGPGDPDAPADCSASSTTIRPQFNPSNGLIQIPVVVHVIEHTNGAGKISNAKVQSQIDILNEDFLALPGTNGANGTDAMIQFYLATTNPQGNPTTGITRSVNNTWFNDGGAYWNTLAWDTLRYLNIYTNSASGALGYVPGLPQGGIVGSKADRVVILWSSFGRNGPIGPPYDLGRTTTHEVGHYFGLYHTFQGACAPAGNCYGNGDRICDTNPENGPRFACPGNPASCGSPDPFRNYLDYSDDLCMEEFTPEQVNRMRCTIDAYRPQLPQASCGAATVATRNIAPNPNVYTATAPVIGAPVTFTVDTQGNPFAVIIGTSAPLEQRSDTGYWFLITPHPPRLLSIGPLAGPIAQATQVVTNDPSLCGTTIYTQARLIGPQDRFVLTNSQDLTLGF